MTVLIRLLFLIIVVNVPVYASQTAVGKISMSKGSNAAQQPNAELRLLGKEAEIYQGDNIQTSDDGVVMLEFIDYSKAVIRPNSNFKIEQFDNETKHVKLHLYSGNMHIRTGSISDSFQIKTPTELVTTDKSSDYSVSVCEGECNKNSSQDSVENAVAKVVEMKGDVFAKNTFDKNAVERKLTVGSDINVHDHLSSQANSFLVLVFKDNQKITLQPDSEFDVVQYDYQQVGKKDSIKFKLLAGGLRALTGIIGKQDHSAYALDTPVASIGIRGTETEHIENPDGSGIYSHVTEGSISITNEAGEIVLNQSENAFTASMNSPTVQISELPQLINFQLENTPRPSRAPDFMFNPRANSDGSIVKLNNKGMSPPFGRDEKGMNKFSPPNGNGFKGMPDGLGFKSAQPPMSNSNPSHLPNNLNRDEALMPKFGTPLEMSDDAENHHAPDFKFAGNSDMPDKAFSPMMGENGGHVEMPPDGFNFPKNLPDFSFSDKELNTSMPPSQMTTNIGEMPNGGRPDNFPFDSIPPEIKNADIVPILHGKLQQKVNDFVIQQGKLREDANYNFTFDEMKLNGEPKNSPKPSLISIPSEVEVDLPKTTDKLITITPTDNVPVNAVKPETSITIPTTTNSSPVVGTPPDSNAITVAPTIPK